MSSEFIRILLVEHNIQDTALFTQLMETNRFRTYPELQYSVRTVTTLKEGVDLITAGEADVAVIDLLLPDTTPNEILDLVKETYRKIPIVALTTDEHIEIAIEAIRHGAQDYLIKSRVTGDLIERAVRYAIERKRIEERLKESEEKYRGLFDNIDEGFELFAIIRDEKGKICDLKYLEVNTIFEKETGLKARDVLGRRLKERFPDIEPVWIEKISGVEETGESVRSVEYNHNTHKYYDTLIFRVAVGQIGSLFRDITERKKAEEALTASEALFRSMFKDNNASMLLIDPTTGDIIDANQVACEYYGYRCEGLLKLKIFDINALSPEDVRAEMSRSLNGEKRHFDSRHRLANGEVRDVEVYTGPINMSGRPFLFSIIHDVTDRKRIEEELRKRTNELARSNADLEQFAYVASHDIKEPLRMVISYLHLLEKNYSDKLDDKALGYMHFAVDGAARMQAMIGDLLAYSHLDTNGKSFTPVNMDEVLAMVLNDLRVSIKESGASITNETLPTVTADTSQMVLLLENLIGNSIKYRGEEAPQIHVSAHDDGREWVFTVEDNGIGIDPKHKGSLFQMFQRLHTREEYEGTGMGLALARRVVERHGGRIWVESEVGKGSTFFFTIPARTT